MMPTRRQVLALPAALPFTTTAAAQKPRLRREASFFGIHLDLHPNDRDPALGRDLTPEMVARFLDRIRPDYVQYDCKGHVGFLGYPSRVSTSAPTVKDSLAIWRQGTAARGVALYIHFSGVWDSLAVRQRPEWARIRPDGAPDQNQTSLFSSYVNERMIPQLKEAAANYDLDGAWVDGECWATNPDYSPQAAEEFRRATGIAALPKGPEDPGWLDFLEFNRRRFRAYVRHYIDEMHRFRPTFQIASNWLYSTFVPERPDLPVDFISGDYLGNASISRARLEARYIAATGKPWDLMAWGFQSARNNPVGEIHKPAVHLMQEASVVLAQGGGFQIYYQPTRAGWVDDRHIGVMAKVAAFCRARQAVCHQSEPVPQVGVLFSKETLYRTTGKLFGGWGAHVNPAAGLLDALLESHYSVDVIPDWKLEEVMRSYPVLVVPDWSDIGAEVAQLLRRYAEGGGRLVLVGAPQAALFADLLGIRPAGEPADQRAYLPGEEVFANLRGRWQGVEPAGSEAILFRHPTYDSTREAQCAATWRRVGQGEVVGFYGPLGSVFAQTHAPEVRRVAAALVARLFQPRVTVEAPPTVEIALRRKAGRTVLHLANTTAMQVAGDYAAIDFVPPVGPIGLRAAFDRDPGPARLEPESRPLRGGFRNGIWSATLDRLEIHTAVVWNA